MSQIKWVIIAELTLDSGTEYVSGERVRRSTSPGQVIYSGTVQRWGTIEKSIPCPSGMPQISNARIRISDHYRHWRDLLAAQTPRRRIMSITVLPEGASVADYAPVYVGEVVDVLFQPAAIEIELRDRTYAWLDEEIPAMVVPELFPDVSAQDEGGFLPIVFGECVSPDESPAAAEGIVPLPHIGFIGFTSPPCPAQDFDRWGLAATPVLDQVIYRRQTAAVDADIDQPEWVVVDEAEYIISTEDIAAEDNPYGSFSMTFSYVDFLEQQQAGTEIRADIRGIYTRGQWGPLSAVDGSPTSTLRNPIDAIINMTFFVMQKAGVSTDIWDTDEVAALRQRFETLQLYCGGAITEPLTCREWLGRFLPSFNLDMYQNRRGKLTLAFSETDFSSPPTTAPIFKEGKHILQETFTERLPENIVTQLQYRFEFDNARDRFASWGLVSTSDQAVLNLPGTSSPPTANEKIEKDVIDLYFVRDSSTATEIISRRIAHLALGSFRQEFDMPMPATLDDVELAQLCKITHSMGLEAPSGYLERQAKILRIGLDLDTLTYHLETMVYPPVSFVATVTPSEGRPTIAEEWEDPTQVNAARSRIEDGLLAIDDDAPLGDSLTRADLQITLPNSITPNYAILFLYGFPEPDPEQTLDSVEIHIVTEWDGGGNSNLPEADAWIFNQRTTQEASLSPPGFIEFIHEYLATESRNEYSVSYTAAEFTSFFGGLGANVYVRFQQWQRLSVHYIPDVHFYIYDCWIEYNYA